VWRSSVSPADVAAKVRRFYYSYTIICIKPTPSM
jgi:hypothetical protein